MQTCSDPSRENTAHALDVEVFRIPTDRVMMTDTGDLDCSYPAGWYYWFHLPGCAPDRDPVGPFDSREDALADAREGSAS